MTSGDLFLSDVRVGDQITPLECRPDEVQLFHFSAATHNAHRIHYDIRYATEIEMYPSLLVHGPLQEALIARALTDWGGGRARLRRLSVQNRASAFAGDRLRATGTVVEVCEEGIDSGIVTIDARLETDSGAILMPARATLLLPRHG